MDTALIGNAGNTASQTGYGAASYAFQMGRTEVTNDQDVSFLESVMHFGGGSSAQGKRPRNKPDRGNAPLPFR